jgi:hypothetical protein
MKKFWPFLLAALFLAACGPLPIPIDLLPALKQGGYDQGTFTKPLTVPPGTPLKDQTVLFPDGNGFDLRFDVPSLPANPASLVLDYQADFSYRVDCVDSLGGKIQAQAYLAKDSASLWNSPLEGAAVTANLAPEDTLRLSGQARLSQAQLDAVMSGHAVLGLALSTENASGQASSDSACVQNGQTQVRISGEYRIQRAVVEVRFF